MQPPWGAAVPSRSSNKYFSNWSNEKFKNLLLDSTLVRRATPHVRPLNFITVVAPRSAVFCGRAFYAIQVLVDGRRCFSRAAADADLRLGRRRRLRLVLDRARSTRPGGLFRFFVWRLWRCWRLWERVHSCVLIYLIGIVSDRRLIHTTTTTTTTTTVLF